MTNPSSPTIKLAIVVSAGAKVTKVSGWRGEALKVQIAAPPERGKANEALLDLLAKNLKVPQQQLRLLRGATSRDKVIEILGLTLEEVRALLP
jgi:uncharacterized protein (TIGR00251 family)